MKNLFLFLSFVSSFKSGLGDPIVQLPNGKIRGREGTTSQGTTYYGFEKVPYAAPPVGDLRFKAPQPPLSWEGTRDTIGRNISCYQQSEEGDYESEDCLFANIYTTVLPDSENGTLLPVMFFMHGGGFVGGSSMEFEPENLLDNGVIVVTINYRLGPFGFLSTQDEVIPGNNGLKDQQQAIMWVYDNILLFGGDPKLITIFGQSAGSASVTYQLLNKKTEGMIKGAICESGTFLSPWSFQRNSKEIAFTTAAFLNSTFSENRNSSELLEFLLQVPADDLDWASEQYHEIESANNLELSQGFYWAAVVEEKNEDAFLTKKMFGLLKEGNFIKVPTLIGINSEEMLFVFANQQTLEDLLVAYDETPEWMVPHDMAITDQNKMVEIGKKIKKLYVGEDNLIDHLGDGVRFFSDNSFTRSVIKYAEMSSQYTSTYFYQFSYDGEIGGYDINYDGAEHVGHNEELNYLFGNTTYSKYSESDLLTQKRLMKIWTDFAKFQNPTPEASELLQNLTWPVLNTEGDFLYVDINKDLQIKSHPKNNTYVGWEQLYGSLDSDDFDTY